jgi:hypothetical protein
MQTMSGTTRLLVLIEEGKERNKNYRFPAVLKSLWVGCSSSDGTKTPRGLSYVTLFKLI